MDLLGGLPRIGGVVFDFVQEFGRPKDPVLSLLWF
jgi:hypothetical protein